MRVAIIGCGYVGSAVAKLWHERGIKVTVTTTTPEKQEQLQAIASQVVVLVGANLTALQQLVAQQDVIVLCAGAKQRTQEAYRQAYLTTAQNLVTAIQQTPTVKQLIYTSSYGILGDQQGETIDETAIPQPNSEYSEILNQTEQVILSVPESTAKTCILRLSGIYGKNRELIKIFGKISGTTRPGAGTEYTNWVHLDDIVGAINFAVQQQLQGIYHLASDRIYTTKEFFSRLFATHNLPDITWDSSQPSTRAYNMKLSNQKIKSAGYQFLYPDIEF